MTIDWVQRIGQSPVCQILLQTAARMLVTASPPACINSVGMLSTPADFPFFKDLNAASISSRRIGKLSSLVFIGQSNTVPVPLVWLLYNSVQYSVHLSSVRHFAD